MKLSFILYWLVETVHAEALDNISKYCLGLHTACGGAIDSDFVVRVANQLIMLISDVISGAALIAILWGGIRIITSGGNDEGRTQGQSIILAAIVGLGLSIIAHAVVIFAAYVATFFY